MTEQGKKTWLQEHLRGKGRFSHTNTLTLYFFPFLSLFRNKLVEKEIEMFLRNERNQFSLDYQGILEEVQKLKTARINDCMLYLINSIF